MLWSWLIQWLPTPVPPEGPPRSVAGAAAFQHRGGLFIGARSDQTEEGLPR
jgi:hypothetical protein